MPWVLCHLQSKLSTENDVEFQQYRNQKLQLWFAFEPKSKTKFKCNGDVSLNILGTSLAHVSNFASTATALFWKMPAFCCRRCCLNTKNAELEDGLIQPILVTFTFHPDNTAPSIDVVASKSNGKERYIISAQEVSQITAISVVQRTASNVKLSSTKAAHHRLDFHKLGEASWEGQQQHGFNWLWNYNLKDLLSLF